LQRNDRFCLLTFFAAFQGGHQRKCFACQRMQNPPVSGIVDFLSVVLRNLPAIYGSRIVK
jgi:hypothetical protein